MFRRARYIACLVLSALILAGGVRRAFHTAYGPVREAHEFTQIYTHLVPRVLPLRDAVPEATPLGYAPIGVELGFKKTLRKRRDITRYLIAPLPVLAKPEPGVAVIVDAATPELLEAYVREHNGEVVAAGVPGVAIVMTPGETP